MLKSLLNYTAAADQKMIDVFGSSPGCSDRAILLCSHILNAQHIWISRILYKSPQYERLQVHSPEKFAGMRLQNATDFQNIVDTLSLEKEIDYKNSDGSGFRNSIQEILYHCVNHSTYHRGQLAAEFRQSGITPPVTDLIIFQRSGKL